MKIAITFVLMMLVMVLGCTPAPKQDEIAPVPASEIDVDELLDGYKDGEWITDYAAAFKFAAELKRPVLINFTGSDWCSWCIKLNNEVFTQPAFNAYAEKNLILLKLDFPRRIQQSQELKAQNAKAQDKFGIRGYPTIILADANEKEIARTGYQPGGAEAYVTHLQQLLTKK